MTIKNQQHVVTHTLKSVRHHRITVRLPDAPGEAEEAFVVEVAGCEIRLRPGDFQQFINCLQKSLNDVTGGHHQ